MEFDKSRVFTALNADELKPGDKVIVADDLMTLKRRVKLVDDDKRLVVELSHIDGEGSSARFDVWHQDLYGGSHALAYLVERARNCTNCGEGRWDAEHKKILCDPVNCGNGNVVFRNHEIEVCEYWKPITKQKAKKHYRPFKDTDELIKVWCDKGGKWQKRELTMPYIWVQTKNAYKAELLITGYEPGRNLVTVDNDDCDMEDLFKYFEFLDGSPCGVEE